MTRLPEAEQHHAEGVTSTLVISRLLEAERDVEGVRSTGASQGCYMLNIIMSKVAGARCTSQGY